jgi:hypothetical protein
LEEKVFKSLIEKLSEAHDRRSQSLELDPDLVARSMGFGSVVEIAEPLPESPFPTGHAEDDTGPLPDQRARLRRPPVPVLLLANARLTSITPKSAELKERVLAMLGEIQIPLQQLDALVELLETEHFEAIDARWEEIRQAGRTLHDSLPELEQGWGEWQNFSNNADQEKQQRRHDLEHKFEERKHLSTWATTAEIKAADQAVSKAQNAAKLAGEKAFEYRKSLAAAESKLISARETLRLMRLEMQRLDSELAGTPYHDPETGLSIDPMALQNPMNHKRISDLLNRHYASLTGEQR